MVAGVRKRDRNQRRSPRQERGKAVVPTFPDRRSLGHAISKTWRLVSPISGKLDPVTETV